MPAKFVIQLDCDYACIPRIEPKGIPGAAVDRRSVLGCNLDRDPICPCRFTGSEIAGWEIRVDCNTVCLASSLFDDRLGLVADCGTAGDGNKRYEEPGMASDGSSTFYCSRPFLICGRRDVSSKRLPRFRLEFLAEFHNKLSSTRAV